MKTKHAVTDAVPQVDGNQKVFKVTIGDKVGYTAATNPVRAACTAFKAFGGAIEEVPQLTPHAILDAISTLTEAEREALVKSIAPTKKK